MMVEVPTGGSNPKLDTQSSWLGTYGSAAGCPDRHHFLLPVGLVVQAIRWGLEGSPKLKAGEKRPRSHPEKGVNFNFGA